MSQAARTAGAKPITSPEQLQEDLESQELKEAYSEQVTRPPVSLACQRVFPTSVFTGRAVTMFLELWLLLGCDL